MTARTSTRAKTILSARGISNRFGRQVVHDNLSLDITRGEIIGIAGGSGSGKSVLLKTLVGLRQPDAGEVLINGKPASASFIAAIRSCSSAANAVCSCIGTMMFCATVSEENSAPC